ncbi:AraC family transcriptional regulator [Actinoplanes sp. GCM10030250]|uniref:helix-turn-helix transcriptional regulator n=1 Tax=Actinoplanes sp. GCM10030250 TaxID=3273376 RepID=UPI003616EE7A
MADTVEADDAPLAEWGHPPHVHDEHLFVYAPLGHIAVNAQDREFLVNAAAGLWIPAGVVHGARFSRDALVLSEEFETPGHDLPYRDAIAVEVTPDVREWLLARSRIATGEPPGPGLFAALAGLRPSRLPLPEPYHPIARAVARELAGNPGDKRTAAEWAAGHFTSSTSLRRAFRAETGLAFTEWRTRLRLNHSLDLLAKGLLVGAVAVRVGFTSANGYILAFRRHFGETPGAYIARRSPGGPHDGQSQDS